MAESKDQQWTIGLQCFGFVLKMYKLRLLLCSLVAAPRVYRTSTLFPCLFVCLVVFFFFNSIENKKEEE